MRVPRSQIGFESDGQCHILHPFVKLKEMRVTFPNADPNNFHRAFGRKCPDAFDRQKEGAKLDQAKLFTQGKIDILRNIGKETEGKMHLIARSPTNTANARVKIDQTFSD